MAEKICLIDNMAAHYRKSIYVLMDKEFNIDWFFGEPQGDIKKLDYSLLGRVTELKTEQSRLLPCYWLIGMSRLIKEYDKVFMIGEPALLSTWLLLARYRLFYPNKKVFFWTHGWYGKESRLKSFIKKLYFKLGSGVITYGDYARYLMIKEGFDSRKVIAIHNSLNYDEQVALRNQIQSTDIYQSHFKNENKNLIFIGRLSALKRLDLLLDALALMCKKGIFYNLTFVGNGRCKDELEQKVAKLGLQHQVWFYGDCYEEKTNGELIYNADLCVAPGNVGLTAMHSMVFGTPVITHNNFAYQMPEFEAIKEDTTGCFFHQDDSADLARCISDWFAKHSNDRDVVRQVCYKEIDTSWNPQFQMRVLKKVMGTF